MKTNVAIIGVGLIGGSLGMALKKRAPAKYRVVGIGRHPGKLRIALRRHAVDEVTTDFSNGVKNADIIVYSDSKYVVDAVEKGWVFKWLKKDFKKKKNEDLWLRFLQIYKAHNVKFHWIKGHNENPENEVCDKLAVKASEATNPLVNISRH